MFYSHEILTNQQHGVATVWLVSTIGLRSTNRKISRKAIQEVDVQKTCDTILHPGAPIALRLQGHLLHGVSQVYSQQCTYVLTDAEKVQSQMRTFYGMLSTGDHIIDLRTTKTKRNQLMLQDDPGFEITMNLPVFDFDDRGNLVASQVSQASRKTSSQLSPLQRSILSSGGGGSLLGGFDLPHSWSNRMSSQLESPLKPGSIGFGSMGNEPLPFPEDDAQVFEDLGIEIDSDGNIITHGEDEPELPKLSLLGSEGTHHPVEDDDPFAAVDDEGDVVMNFNDPPLPEAEAFPPHQQEEQQPRSQGDIYQQALESEISSDRVVTHARKRKPPVPHGPDVVTKVNRSEIRAWGLNYLADAERARKTRRGATIADAKKNAFHFIFGRGLADVGFPGIPKFTSPLAQFFAGEELQAQLLGIAAEQEDNRPQRGRRRTALEALELEDEDAERRVRPRLDTEEPEQAGQGQGQGQAPAQQQENDDPLVPGDEEEAEVGRKANSALPDLPSDLPWNRPSSQIPGSSARQGTAEPGQFSGRPVSASPLHGRGSHLPEIERFSDQPVFGSDGFAPLHSANTFSDPIMEGGPTGSQEAAAPANVSQVMRQALDSEGHNFLSFMEGIAKEKGYLREEDGRHWVDFDDLFQQGDKSRAVLVQAFYHLLSLTTKNAIKVEQDSQNIKPFGTIRVGIQLPDAEDAMKEIGDSQDEEDEDDEVN
ncbi:Rec8 like protein-domain-containing protein [Podospora appendiculata]|uniref:Rec8 like protein-domain-containing protein n=1 Tax=Podospora appendiculata TaxID=314037 RepID=A0AAE1CHR5_9PEZI|nr:Rec8 like protein-domain-containing protein [Podospora appendiculata]